MNAQEIFDQVVAHLRKQGHQAIKETKGFSRQCVYRASNGDRCAVGCLISDDEYNPNMEGRPVYKLLYEDGDFGPAWELKKSQLKPHLHLLRSLQKVHDHDDDDYSSNEERIADWEQSFRRIARDYELNYQPPTYYGTIKGQNQ